MFQCFRFKRQDSKTFHRPQTLPQSSRALSAYISRDERAAFRDERAVVRDERAVVRDERAVLPTSVSHNSFENSLPKARHNRNIAKTRSLHSFAAEFSNPPGEITYF